jgi:predicted RNA-binding protein YlxR (DUF448 family)
MLISDHQDARDHGPRKTVAGSERLCAATGEVKCVDHMIRFVMGPGQTVVPDLKRRLPGRGLWVTATRGALELAIRRNCFARGFKREMVVEPELVQMTEGLLERSALDALAMAHKAGSSSMRAKRRLTGSESSVRHVMVARAVPQWRSSATSRRRNWIWHWDGQM